MIHSSPNRLSGIKHIEGRRKSMDPVSEFIRFDELPDPNGRFEFQELLGVGSSSKVHAALDKKTGERVAIKVINNIAENILEIESEFRVLSLIGGKFNTPKLHGLYLHLAKDSKREIWFVIEICEGILLSNLLKYLKKQEKYLNENQIGMLMKSFLMAVQHLHKNGIIHRDIRASNFILTPQGDIKLIDYGFCAIVENKEKCEVHLPIGTPYWMAPEVISSERIKHYSKSCDVWSLGITAIELAEREPPLNNVHPVRAMFQIARYPPPTLPKGKEWTDVFRDFISECLMRNSDHRPCVLELLFHPFIAEADQTHEKITLEEHLAQGGVFSISEKGKNVLMEIFQMVPKLDIPISNEPEYFTVKNWHLKKGPESKYEKICPDDIACLEDLCEESIVDLVRERIQRDEVYVFIGDILLSIKAENVPPHRDTEIQLNYCEKARSDNPPHIFAVADRAYQQMLHHKMSQVIILQGLSGSGKSFMVEQLTNHLAFLGRSTNADVASKIPHLCFLLEAFGNACTAANSNSSRSMKSILVTFTKSGKITGAVIDAILLDPKRVSSIPPNEKNFHVFYYMYEGLKAEKRLSEFGLNKLSDLKYLPKDNIAQKEMIEQYKKLIAALKSVAFTDQEIKTIMRIISAILLLGNIEFHSKGNDAELLNCDILDIVSDNLQLQKCKLKAFFSEMKTIKKAQAKRDMLAQYLYFNLLNWLITTLNRHLSFSRLVLGDHKYIHVIDPPGYQESAENHEFHLTSNVINDHIYNFVHSALFLNELEEYKREEVNVPFTCEGPALNMHDYLTMDETYTNLMKSLEKGNLPKSAENRALSIHGKYLTVQHMFEKVNYKLSNFVNEEVIDEKLLSTLIPDSIVVHASNKINMEYASCIQKARDILAKVTSTAVDFPHVVICMNTSEYTDGKGSLNNEALIKQVHLFKVQETAALRQKGFARRLPFAEFLDRYKYLAFDFNEEVELTKDNCRLLLIRLKVDGWEIGQNKIFLRYYTEEYLSRLYEVHIKKIIKIQAVARRFIVKMKRATMLRRERR